MFTKEIRFELESNSTNFVKNELWMNKIFHAKVAIIWNVEFDMRDLKG